MPPRLGYSTIATATGIYSPAAARAHQYAAIKVEAAGTA
jgi:hypothetical protein